MPRWFLLVFSVLQVWSVVMAQQTRSVIAESVERFVRDERRLVQLRQWEDHRKECRMWGDKDQIERVIDEQDAEVEEKDPSEMDHIIEDCQKRPPNSGAMNVKSDYDEPIHIMGWDFGYSYKAIFPGTKWCGAGNVASSDSDLGFLEAVDRCCRDHDKCPDSILAGETSSKHGGLHNPSKFTRSRCDCDRKFNKCLTSTCNLVSWSIGKLYFNVLGFMCFRNSYPSTGCAKRGDGYLKKCRRYKYDTSKEKKWQFFETPVYSQSTCRKLKAEAGQKKWDFSKPAKNLDSSDGDDTIETKKNGDRKNRRRNKNRPFRFDMSNEWNPGLELNLGFDSM